MRRTYIDENYELVTADFPAPTPLNARWDAQGAYGRTVADGCLCYDAGNLWPVQPDGDTTCYVHLFGRAWQDAQRMAARS